MKPARTYYSTQAIQSTGILGGKRHLRKLKRENKPVFLSIGYSTCHWCHVMAHESFEDPNVARIMNKALISVKVDREERPDIDKVYMSVCQMMTGSGGWPLTIIMTPDKQPFFAATYIPKETRYGRIGLLELIPRISELWSKKHAEVLNSANQITDALRECKTGSAWTIIERNYVGCRLRTIRGAF